MILGTITGPYCTPEVLKQDFIYHSIFIESFGLTTLLLYNSFLFYPLRQLQLIYYFVGDKGETNDLLHTNRITVVYCLKKRMKY